MDLPLASASTRASARSLRHDIVDALRADIVCGRLTPGDRVLEVELARRFGVSRQPVREAIRSLEREGLLTSLPNRGTFVTRVSAEDALAIIDLRIELEGLAARRAVKHLTPGDARRLREIPKLMRQVARRADRAALVTLDLEFHELVLSRSQHHLLQAVLASLAVYTRGFIVHTKNYYGADLAQVATAHERLAEALVSGDPVRAEAAAQAHIREAAERLARLTERSPDDQA
jgi:DNA-binding GntR family transcriptional regulator